ncbi:alpha/beta hydrolase [Enterococcus sp. OL5]|uniref:alpha/beta hydrolase n=1 Tax=Enterococcus sp. OL5 TaxID=2590214 RepID=UPI00112A8D81|nr:alpha/beta hydrolase [Enterococcus sp. OL5]TPR55563.1 alpha/beta hydrolase [Enterococcus sp. OL5]
MIEKKAENTYWLDAKTTYPDTYTKITGFEMTYRLIKSGALGGDFQLNALMIANGAYQPEEFAMSFEGVPRYVGKAKELITHATGAGSYTSYMFFKHGFDAGNQLAEGETTTVTYDGNMALFNQDAHHLTACGIFGEFEILAVEWKFGEIDPNATIAERTWEPVETDQYLDIPTTEPENSNQMIDITVPKGEGPYPVIFWIHGGAWTQFTRKSVFIGDTMEFLLSKGFAIVSAEYTLSVNQDNVITPGYPQMIYDLKAAVRFIRANHAKYRLDTNFIAAMGESAGGHLSLLMGTTNDKASHEDLTMGNPEESSAIQAIVSYFGPTDMHGIMGELLFGADYSEEKVQEASPLEQMTPACPPMFLTHGMNDQAVTIDHSYKMEAKAREVIGEDKVTTLFYENGPHANIDVFDSQKTMDAVYEFLKQQLNK